MLHCTVVEEGSPVLLAAAECGALRRPAAGGAHMQPLAGHVAICPLHLGACTSLLARKRRATASLQVGRTPAATHWQFLIAGDSHGAQKAQRPGGGAGRANSQQQAQARSAWPAGGSPGLGGNCRGFCKHQEAVRSRSRSGRQHTAAAWRQLPGGCLRRSAAQAGHPPIACCSKSSAKPKQKEPSAEPPRRA